MKIRTLRRVDPHDLTKQVGRRLRQARKAKGLTMAEVADAMGVTRSAVNNWELGTQHGFMLNVLYDLAMFYRVPIRRLLP